MRGDGATDWPHSSGLPLGLLPVGGYGAGEVTLAAGDTAVLYTDGITEANNPDDEEFGKRRLEEVCITCRHLPPGELAAVLDRELDASAKGVPFADDRTLVIVRKLA